MANRFTDNMKWDDAFFMDLLPVYKLFWLYICDKCDHAGIWKVNKRLADAQIGADIELSEALRFFGERIQILDSEKWFIVGFIGYQYKGGLNPENNAHKGVLSVLSKHGLAVPDKGLTRGYLAPQDKDKDKDKDKEELLKGFESFWGAYPRRAAKKDVMAKWMRLKPSSALLGTILEAIRNQCQSDQWRKDNGKFIPMPMTWLNQERWNDELKIGGEIKAVILDAKDADSKRAEMFRRETMAKINMRFDK